MEAYQRLEKEFAEWTGVSPNGMVACASGTAALHLGLEALRLPLGASCLCPDFTMIACARAITLAGLEPTFVDCNDRLLLNESILPDEEVAAIMPVHIYGRRCNMDLIHAWAKARRVAVIEDLAEAHGIVPHPDTDAAAWSFFKNKIICCPDGEGGAVWFRDPAHAVLARQLRNCGFTDAHDFWHVPRAHNYRMSNLHARWILDVLDPVNHNGLPHANDNILRRREIESWCDAACPADWRMPLRDVVWMYDLRVPGLTWEKQARVVGELNREGIAARQSFKPCHLQEEYKKCKVVGGEMAKRLSNEVLYLPVSPGTTTRESVSKAFAIIRRTLG